MTITTEVDLVEVEGDGTARVFSFNPLTITEADDLKVTKVAADGTESYPARGSGTTDYSVQVTTYPGTGNVTYPADANGDALAAGESLIFTLNIPALQESVLDTHRSYDPKVVMRALDRLTGIAKGLKQVVSRVPRLLVSDTPAAAPTLERTASRYLRWNASGDGIDAVEIASTDGDASDATPQPVSVSAGAAGSDGDYSRSDHVHLLPTTVPRLATENIFTETQIWLKGGDVASASALALGAGNWFDVTGTTTITSITSIGVGTLVVLHFDASLTLTHHDTNLVLPGGHDIVTEAGDIAIFYEFATGDWRLMSYRHAVPVYRQLSVDPSKKITFYDDFLGDALKDELLAGVGAGTGNAVALSVGAGGRVEVKTASDDGTHAQNGSSIGLGALNWRADQGGLVMEARLQVDDITAVMFFVGFTDALGSTVEAPIYLNGADIDSDAANACGVGYDTDGTTEEFFHGGVKANTDTTPAYSGTAPVNGTYVTIRVEVSAAGAVRGFIDGTAIGVAVADAVTVTTPLVPIVFAANRGAAVRNVLVDYIWVQASR